MLTLILFIARPLALFDSLQEAKAKEVCDVLLFVIDRDTRAIASMLEATEYIMSSRRVVIVIMDIPEGTTIDGEVVVGRQLKDLNRARAFLCDIAARHQKYCDVFDSVERVSTHTHTHPRRRTNAMMDVMLTILNLSFLLLSSSPQAVNHIVVTHPSQTKAL